MGGHAVVGTGGGTARGGSAWRGWPRWEGAMRISPWRIGFRPSPERADRGEGHLWRLLLAESNGKRGGLGRQRHHLRVAEAAELGRGDAEGGALEQRVQHRDERTADSLLLLVRRARRHEQGAEGARPVGRLVDRHVHRQRVRQRSPAGRGAWNARRAAGGRHEGQEGHLPHTDGAQRVTARPLPPPTISPRSPHG